MFNSIFPGDEAPNLPLLQLQSDSKHTECRLLDFVKHNRPLVINLGSCT